MVKSRARENSRWTKGAEFMKAGYAKICKVLNKSFANLKDYNKSLQNLHASLTKLLS